MKNNDKREGAPIAVNSQFLYRNRLSDKREGRVWTSSVR